MSLPDRSTLPAEFVAVLERFDREIERDYARKPILPASSTPQLLVDAATNLDQLIQDGQATGIAEAALLASFLGTHVRAVLDGEVTEPVPDIRAPSELWDGDFTAHAELSEAYTYFVSLIGGRDYSTPALVERFKRSMVTRRKSQAAAHGVELELTDEEWFAL